MKKISTCLVALSMICLKAVTAQAQYCVPTVSTCDEKITNVTLNTINNSTLPTDCGSSNGQGYSNFSGLSTDLVRGNTYVVSVKIGPVYSGDEVDLYVDYNQNDVFDAGEYITTLTGYGNDSVESAYLTVPLSTATGSTRLRARLRYAPTDANEDPCATFTYGETEDYSINIISSTPCNGTPDAATITNTDFVGEICQNGSGTLYTNDPNITTSIYRIWQSAPTASGPWTTVSVGTDAIYTTPPLSATTYYRMEDSCANSGLVNHSNAYEVKVAPQLVINNQPTDAAACANIPVSFSVGATGDSIDYSWEVNDGSGYVFITNNGLYSGANTATLTISDPTSAMNGYTYKCDVVSNTTSCIQEQSTNEATLYIGVSGNIAANGPTTFCSGNGTPTTLATSNIGTANYTYQWLLNGTTIPNANSNTYVPATSGTYTLQISGANCSVTTNAIPITVTGNINTPTVTPSGLLTICWGSSLMLNASADAGVNYQWNLNNAYILGATGTSFNAQDTGFYTVTVTDPNSGCTATSAPVTINADIIPDSLITDYNGSGSLCSYLSFTTYQWFLNGQAIVSGTAQCYTPTQNGAYTVQVTDPLCAKMSKIWTVTDVAVPGVVLNSKQIKIYPNPANDVVNIDAPQKVSVVVSDMQGQAVITTDKTAIDIHTLAAGLYMVQIYDQTGTLVKTDKLVKIQ